MEYLKKRKRTAAIRRQADENSKYCFTASLAEVAVNIGARENIDLVELEKQMGVSKEGHTSPKQLFRHLRAGADALGLDVAGVVANPSFLDLCDDPLAYSITVRKAIGEIPVSIPNIRIFVNEYESRQHPFHAEVDEGSARTNTRLGNLLSRGWAAVAAIEFKRRE